MIDRIDRAIEGLLDPTEMEAFRADVIRDGELRAAYVDRLWLHSTLRAQRETLPELLASPVRAEKLRWPMALGAAAAAAAVTLAACLAIFGRSTPARQPVATLVRTDNCKWAGSELPTAVGSRLVPGSLALVEGVATLKFTSGATVTLEAPTKFDILSAMHCRLVEGSAVAEVPEPAHGFTIDTPDIKVVDLGTRFGVTTSSFGSSQVRVFEGEVEIGGLPGKQPQKLKEGKGMQVGSGNTAAGQEPSRGQQQMRQVEGWTAIPTSFGHGKDAYIRRGDSHGPTGTHPLIMVKHSDIPASRRNERRAFVTFDVSQVATRNVAEAELVLDPEPSGLGFTALVPDARFAVYGFTDQTLDEWDEKQVLWDSAPACNDDGPLPAQTRKLAEFFIPRGGSGEPLTVRGEALAQFVREDTNGLVSFLIVRETGETDPSGLVHAFASREHPTALPPTLRLK